MATLTYTNSIGGPIADNSTTMHGLTVYGLTGHSVTDVSVTFTGLNHTFAADLDILLVAPTNTNNLMFMSDVGAGADLYNATLTFSDSAPSQVPSPTPAAPEIDSGEYQPTALSAGETDATFGTATGGINAAAPNGSATFASAFGGIDPNGLWSLYIHDDAAIDTGSFVSWSLMVTTDVDTVTLAGAGANDFFSIAPSGATSGEFSVNGNNPVVYSGVSGFVIAAGGGNDIAYGSAGADFLTGGTGRDQLYGGGGGDTFYIVGGDAVANEIYDGGAGTDTLEFYGSAFNVDLRAATIRSIEVLGLNDPGPAATGTVNVNAAQFGAGISLTSTIDGFSFTDASDVLAITMGTVSVLNLSTLNMVDFTAAGDHVFIEGDLSAEQITGTSARDRIFGQGGSDVLNGLGGSDDLFGGLGNDWLNVSSSVAGEIDNLDGGDGIDAAGFAGLSVAIWVDLDFVGYEAQTRDTNNVTSGPWRNIANLTAIENIVGTAYSDSLAGSAANNTFVYNGNVGNIADVYNGRGGNDTVDFSGFGSAIWVDLTFAGVEAQTRGTNNLTSGTWRNIADLLNVESVVDTAYSDQLLGNDLANVFSYTGNVGNAHDIYNGRGGVDTADFSRFVSAVWVDLNFVGVEAQTRDTAALLSGTWRNIADLTGFENLTGTNYADSLSGNTVSNILTGGLGNDSLRGRGGNDFFVFSTIGFGQDIILDWQDTGSGFEDVIDFRGMGLNFSSLVIAYGANATITIGSDMITLTGVTSGLDAGDFLFA